MKKRSTEKYDICEFCETLQGEDCRSTCYTPCACASYINQDYVRQKELTMGLPAPRSLKMPQPLTNTETYWQRLSTEEKKRVSLKVGDMYKNLDDVLLRMLDLLLLGTKKEEICSILDIEEETYWKYADRLRHSVDENE